MCCGGGGRGEGLRAGQVGPVSSSSDQRTCQSERADVFGNGQPREAPLGLVGAGYYGNAFKSFKRNLENLQK